MVEGDIRIRAQADRARKGAHKKEGRKGDKTGNNKMKKGKMVAPEMSVAAHMTTFGYNCTG